MTKNQRIALQADWWPAACHEQGWRTGDRELRLLVCSWAVSLPNPTVLDILQAIKSDQLPARILVSTNDLNTRDDVDRVKSVLGMLSGNLARTGEVGRPEFGRARRLRNVIRAQIKCLGVFQERPRAYVAEIINDKFNRARRIEPITIRDLSADPVISTGRNGNVHESPSQLDQLIMTLGRIVNQKRNAADMTIHEMKLQADVPCDCAQCRSHPSPKEIEIAKEDWSIFEPEQEPAGVADSSSEPNPF